MAATASSAPIAPSAADYAFPGTFDTPLKAVKALADDGVKILRYIIDNGLEGICSAVMQMDPNRLAGIEPLAKRFQSANTRNIESRRQAPLEGFGISFQSATNFADYIDLLATNTPGITSVNLEAARTAAEKIVNGPAVVGIFAQPRRDRAEKIVSIHFTTMFWPKDKPEQTRFVESFNFQKGEGYAPGWNDLVALWAEHGITITTQRKPMSLFERAFAPQGTNTRFGIPDVTEHGHFPEHADLLGSNVFGISANRPGEVIYGTEAVALCEVDSEGHLDLETRHQVGEIARANGTTTFEGLHTGDKSCLNQTANTAERTVGIDGLARLPIDAVYDACCRSAFETYTAKQYGVAINLFFSDRDANFVKQSDPSAVRTLIGDGFTTPSMMTARDATRSAYRTQYIDHVRPHSNPAFNELGLRVSEICVEFLEKLVLFRPQLAAGQSDSVLNTVFGIE
jgi:hypothetical protein